MNQLLKYPTPTEDTFVVNDGDCNHPDGRRYDLAERTAKFGEHIISFVRTVPQNPITKPLIAQIVRSGTSIGANYCEADDA